MWTHRDQFSADFGVRGIYLLDLSPSHTLHPTVIEAQGQSEIDKTRLSRPNRIRDLARTHLLSYHVEDSADENTRVEDPRGLNND